MRSLSFMSALFLLALPALAQSPASNSATPLPVATSVETARGDLALASLHATPTSSRSARTFEVGESGGFNPCAHTSRFKCIAYGAAIGLFSGALLGRALAPKPELYEADTFLGSVTKCQARCDDQANWALSFGIGGAMIGGITGFYFTRSPR